jgi:hypothetical protein
VSHVNPRQTAMMSKKCLLGQKWCPSTGKCIPSSALCGVVPPPPPPAPHYPVMPCTVGHKWCEERKACISNAEVCYPVAPCSVGQKWCPERAACIPASDLCGVAPPPVKPVMPCPVGQSWCSMRGTCIPAGAPCGSVMPCVVGQKWCPTRKTCIPSQALCDAPNPSVQCYAPNYKECNGTCIPAHVPCVQEDPYSSFSSAFISPTKVPVTPVMTGTDIAADIVPGSGMQPNWLYPCVGGQCLATTYDAAVVGPSCAGNSLQCLDSVTRSLLSGLQPMMSHNETLFPGLY